jgi:hypothetical protein
MMVVLPVYPYSLTASYMATTCFVQERTSCLVPRVVAFDSNRRNILGFEWILQKITASDYYQNKGKTLPMSAKLNLMRSLAKYQTELLALRNNFKAIGSLYFAPNPEVRKLEWTDRDPFRYEPTLRIEGSCSKDFLMRPKHKFTVGPLIDTFLYWGKTPKQLEASPIGPYKTARGYFCALIDTLQRHHRAEKLLYDSEAEYHQSLINQLDRLRGCALQDTDQDDSSEEGSDDDELTDDELDEGNSNSDLDGHEPLKTILWNKNLDSDSIFVNESGNLTGITNWGAYVMMPYWALLETQHL